MSTKLSSLGIQTHKRTRSSRPGLTLAALRPICLFETGEGGGRKKREGGSEGGGKREGEKEREEEGSERDISAPDQNYRKSSNKHHVWL